MFSFIKKIQELLAKLKKNKGLLFTTLSVVSITGIALFMYLIMTMTSSIKTDVYISLKNINNKSLENLLASKKKLYANVSNTILADTNVITSIQANDKEKIRYYENLYNSLYKKDSKYPMQIKLYSNLETKEAIRNTITNTMREKNTVFGIETQASGTYITMLLPILNAGSFVGLIETKQAIHTLREFYDDKDEFFAFMLDKKMLVKLSLKAKSGKYNNVISDYTVKQGHYTSRFYSKITDLGDKEFKLALKNSYDSDDKFYRSYRKTTDINGAEIGIFVFGENVEKNNGFVNLVEKMIKSVTYVSLGLVISILMFMF